MATTARSSTLPIVTQAAEGLPRRRFTVAELELMTEAGVLCEDERIELIGGEVVPMSPKGIRHEVLKAALTLDWVRRLSGDTRLITETTFRLSEDTYLEPDVVVYHRADGLRGLRGETALLVVEIADSSLAYDLMRKPGLYARFGVREYWVIDAKKLSLRVHRQPDPLEGNYRAVADYGTDDEVAPLFVPSLALRLANLDIEE